jgi:exodeoxyribonuclease-5
VVADECSMVNAELGRDLLSFDTKCLAIGDRAQLPPIEGGGYFTSSVPDFSLTEVHRQALDSPVIRLATEARLDRPLRPGNYGASSVVPKYQEAAAQALLASDQVIAGKHETRCEINRQIRRVKGFEGPPPLPGEKVVCLKNRKGSNLLNGTTWEVVAVSAERNGFIDLTVKDNGTGEIVEAVSPVATFGLPDNSGIHYPRDPFDWGYVLTCHKSQGSEWDHVCLIDQSYLWRRDNTHTNWLYTGITRAAESVTIVM